MKIVAPALFAAIAFASPAHAGWTGLLVSGSFATNQTLLTQFVSPQVVGPATEFSGTMRDAFNQNWTISVDVADDYFSVSFLTPGNANGNVRSSALMSISLSGLTNAASLALQSYNCTPSGGFPCTTMTPLGPNVTSLNATNTTATVTFDTMRTSEVYRFGVNAAAVPEPAAWALMMVGFGVLGAALRRRAPAFASA